MSSRRDDDAFILLERRGRRGGDELLRAPTLEEMEDALREMTGRRDE